MVLIAQGHEAEGLKTGALGWGLYLGFGFRPAHGLEHFGHAVDWAGAGLEGYFYEIAGGELALQLEQTAGDGNGLKFCARAASAFNLNGSSDGTVEMDSGRAPGGVGLGEMGHSHEYYDTAQWAEGRLPKQVTTGVCLGRVEVGIRARGTGWMVNHLRHGTTGRRSATRRAKALADFTATKAALKRPLFHDATARRSDP